MTQFAAISALIIRLRTFGFLGPTCHFYPKLAILMTESIHLFDRIIDLLIIAEHLYLSTSYNEGIIPNYSDFSNSTKLSK